MSPATVGADSVVSDGAYFRALCEAEAAWGRALETLGAAPAGTGALITDAAKLPDDGAAELALAAVGGGNPVIPLIPMIRERAGDAATWVHRGLTSQDVVDTALMSMMTQAVLALDTNLARVVSATAALAHTHRDTVCVARTLGQFSVPTTVGRRIVGWTQAVADARELLALAVLPVQLGGASGTLASLVEIVGADTAAAAPTAWAAELGLAVPVAPWHTVRTPLTRFADALVTVTDALGLIANDVVIGARSEIGELSEPTAAGRGGSSAMPQKQNPVLSVMMSSATRRAPGLGAELHRSAADAVDERPVGAWHAEWPTLRELARIALGSAAMAAELTEGLHVHTDAVAANLRDAGPLLMSERVMLRLSPEIGRARVQEIVDASMPTGDLAARLAADPEVAALGIDVNSLLDPAGYVGVAPATVDAVLADLRAKGQLP